MKQLKIKLELSQFKENHIIYIGFNEQLKSKSKNFLKLYLRTYKKVILDNLRIVNKHNSEIYSLFRNFYFDLPTIEVSRITELFNNFNKSINWIFQNIGGDQNSIFFSKIHSCIEINSEILNILKNYCLRYKNYSLKNQVSAYLKIHHDFLKNYQNERQSLNLNTSYLDNDLQSIENTLKFAI